MASVTTTTKKVITVTKKTTSNQEDTSNRITKSLITKLENNPHIEGLNISLPLLEKIIIKAIDAYYNTDKPLLTDNTYDILETILKEKKPNSKAFEKVGAPVAPADAIKLPYYLGSLDKVKPGERVLTRWLDSHKGPILISEKLDGLSSLLIIELAPGNKDLIMRLFKHGDGYEGQDISHLLSYLELGTSKLNKLEVVEYIKSTPKKQLALRGEIIIKTSVYNSKYTKMYPKARSLIAGVVNSKTVDANVARDMEIVFYELIYPDGMKFSDQFSQIASLGFNLAMNKLYSTINEKDLPEILLDFKKNSKYEIDGIILTDDSKPHSRATEKNPKYSVAFKMLLDDQVATTTVINVEYNVSKHGFLVPRIQYEPVVIKGDTHQYTTGFYAKYIQDNKIGPGAVIQIVKSGDVIPYIYQVVTPAKTAQMPPATVKWHWDNSELEAVLDNIDENVDVLEKRVINFFEVMKIAGVGPGNVAKLIAAGYDDTQKILSLTPDMIAQVEGFQLKSATNLYNSIQKVISVEQPLERIMAASNTFGVGMGERKMGALLGSIPNFLEKWKNGKIGKNDIMQVEGFSDKTADMVIEGMPRFLAWLEMHSMLKFSGVKKVVEATSNKFAGMVAVFTGVRDAEMEKKIIEGGGEIGSGVNKKTTILVAKDIGESSSKITKARDMGIQVISYSDFKKMF